MSSWDLLAICYIRMLKFSVKNAVAAFFMSFWQWMQTLMSETSTDLQNIALLDGHPVKCLSRRGLVQNLGIVVCETSFVVQTY